MSKKFRTPGSATTRTREGGAVVHIHPSPQRQHNCLTMKNIERDCTRSCADHRIRVLEEPDGLRVEGESGRRIDGAWSRGVGWPILRVRWRIVSRGNEKEVNGFASHRSAAHGRGDYMVVQCNLCNASQRLTKTESSERKCSMQRAPRPKGQRGMRSGHLHGCCSENRL